jgi:DUF1680 family protein
MWVNSYLLRWTGEPVYADQYERNLYNGIISAQNPDDGQFTYFTPMAPGTRKVFGTPTESFWCCYGTGVQALSDLGSSIYLHSPDHEVLYVNLYAPSEVTWERGGDAVGPIRIEQATDYPIRPESELTVHLDSAQAFELAIRIPWWVGDDTHVALNGEPLGGPFLPSTFYRIRREWQDGDQVRLVMPMHWTWEPLPDGPDVAALMYGPLVMVVLASGEVVLDVNRSEPQAWIEANHRRGLVPGIGTLSQRDLRFLIPRKDRDWQLLPLYQVRHDRYTMYLRPADVGIQKYAPWRSQSSPGEL